MDIENLLKLLRDNGLEDEQIKALLEEALKSFDTEEPEEDEEMEKEQAKKLLGVEIGRAHV